MLSACADLFLGDDFEAPACSGGEARPLSIQVVARTLREHGFNVQPEGRSEICGGVGAEEVVADLTNVHFDGPYENIESHDEVQRREGMVICAIRRGPLWGNTLQKDLDAPAASPIFSGPKAVFFLANVECTIYPDEDRRQEQVGRLDRAMTRLVEEL